ncbi:MAG: T9SS type A sorting domain-containing protein [Bacteroidetes bacterium]|nr:T9SS type A sorting domain-containing protein [Bacteroidota bacterium]
MSTGITTDLVSKALEVYPNPASKSFTIQLQSEFASKVRIRLTDITGKVVLEKNETIAAGENTIAVHSENLTNGIYILEVTDKFMTHSSRMMIAGN